VTPSVTVYGSPPMRQAMTGTPDAIASPQNRLASSQDSPPPNQISIEPRQQAIGIDLDGNLPARACLVKLPLDRRKHGQIIADQRANLHLTRPSIF
jgi:hypothetical protein